MRQGQNRATMLCIVVGVCAAHLLPVTPEAASSSLVNPAFEIDPAMRRGYFFVERTHLEGGATGEIILLEIILALRTENTELT